VYGLPQPTNVPGISRYENNIFIFYFNKKNFLIFIVINKIFYLKNKNFFNHYFFYFIGNYKISF
jgi:hypothetical protein